MSTKIDVAKMPPTDRMAKVIDPEALIPKEANSGNREPGKINKDMILFSGVGLVLVAIIISSIVPSISSSKKAKDRKAYFRDVPDLEKYITQEPEILSASLIPPLGQVIEEEEYNPFIPKAPTTSSNNEAPPTNTAPTPPVVAPVAIEKVDVFTPNFDTSLAQSSMTIPVSPSLTTNLGSSVSSNIPNSVTSIGAATTPTTTTRELSEYEMYQQANLQDEKKSFFARGGTSGITNVIGDYSISPGTIIPAALITGLMTDLPGYIVAQVTENVYGSTGEYLLIPSGSKLIAQYNSVVTFGQNRIQIGWNQLIRPDGIIVNLANSPGVDASGYSGVQGKVDTHAGEILGAVGFSALTTFVTGLSSALIEKFLEQGVLSATSEEVMSQLGNIGYSIAKRWLDVQPSLSLDAGAKVDVMVIDIIDLPEANNSHITAEKYTRKK